MKKTRVEQVETLQKDEEEVHRGHDENRPDVVGQIRKGVG